ncbi:MAG: hypothetical protein J5598_02615, partial [Clostridia bacterium]|nr:hypothetical protein [Clostridia bacterium]
NNKKNEKDYREKEADVWLCAFHNEEDDVVKIFTDIWDYIAVNEANRYFSKNFSGKRSIAGYFNPSSYIGKPKTIQKKHLICKRDEDELAYIEAVKKYDEAFGKKEVLGDTLAYVKVMEQASSEMKYM